MKARVILISFLISCQTVITMKVIGTTTEKSSIENKDTNPYMYSKSIWFLQYPTDSHDCIKEELELDETLPLSVYNYTYRLAGYKVISCINCDGGRFNIWKNSGDIGQKHISLHLVDCYLQIWSRMKCDDTDLKILKQQNVTNGERVASRI